MDEEMAPETVEAICQEIYAGRKIAAIKLYREASGKDLKDAKDFVEGLTERLRAESPEKFTAAEGKGCGTAVAIVICFTVALAAVLV